MKFAAVTTFPAKAYQTDGKRFIESFFEWWPIGVDLHVFHEDMRPDDADPRVQWHPLLSDKDWVAFTGRHHDEGPDQNLHAVKYSHKVFALTGVKTDADWLISIDSDLETARMITPQFLRSICPDDAVAAYLARPWLYTDTCFTAYRLDPVGREFLAGLRAFYTSDAVTKLPVRRDAAAFDALREQYEKDGHRFFNLARGASGIDVLPQSRVGNFIRRRAGKQSKAA